MGFWNLQSCESEPEKDFWAIYLSSPPPSPFLLIKQAAGRLSLIF